MTPIPAPTEERTIYDVQRDLDLDKMLEDAVPPPTCEASPTPGDPKCGRLAVWLSSATCGHSAYYCADCREKWEAIMAAHPFVPVLCPLHPAPLPRVELHWTHL